MQLNVQSPSADYAGVSNAASHLNGAGFQFSQCFLNVAILPTRKKQISLRTKTTTTYLHCKVETLNPAVTSEALLVNSPGLFR